jgi:hypothetical protein
MELDERTKKRNAECDEFIKPYEKTKRKLLTTDEQISIDKRRLKKLIKNKVPDGIIERLKGIIRHKESELEEKEAVNEIYERIQRL